MNDGDMLARLIAQTEEDGVGLVTVRALIEEASELGAGRALARLGLSDAGAEKDVRELRELLGAWRDAKRTARNAVIGWIVRGVLAMLLMAVAVRVGVFGILRG
ncbi:DUF6127 family protein [Rhizorhapis suberifaciens]|uniref:Uncharacterized protein n=1 Tax=Rhizorhapis suberifaciens TaxID=13656 RepID=A0A840HVY6_9SPHN|nr:DUF6127 family protein [Rhizorhapis suberifaciens]MBB4641740.1 hypothetical protein [Rhizorhapis suberifaciens]